MQHAPLVRTVATLAVVLVLAGCGAEGPAPTGQPIFGNGTRDQSRVLADVNGYEITERMLELRLGELSPSEQARYDTPEDRRLFLRRMVDQVLQVQDAQARKLHLDPVVAQVLISERREALLAALHVDLVKDRQPDVEAVKDYFERNRENYMQMAAMNAAHVECLTRADAEKAYRLLAEDRVGLPFVVKEHSRNPETKARHGDLGWFNPGGFIGGIPDSREFISAIWDLDQGPNPPLEFRGRWHVVVVKNRIPERPQTLDEVYDRVLVDMQEEFRRELQDRWLQQARQEADIRYFGEYSPGQGRTAEQLFERAYYLTDPQQRLDLLGLLVDDFPENELADKALMMAATIALDDLHDPRLASNLLATLVERYPRSELIADAEFMIENMFRPGFRNPQSIEDIRSGR